MKNIAWGKLVSFIVICELVGVVGSIFTINSIPSWYAVLNKPTFSPPNWLFGPVWTLLYALMGIAFYVVWQKRKEISAVKTSLNWFVVQLVLNGIWTPIFFGLKDLQLAFFVICAMWVSILVTIVKFWRISKTSSILLWPYLVWVSFALILNLFVWRLNI